MNRTKQILFSTITISLGFLLGFAILEVTVRLLRLAPPLTFEYGDMVRDPHLPYLPRPLSVSSGRSSTDEYDFEYRHNSVGFRDGEHAQEKADGVFRILGLGDSFTYGVAAKLEETYLYLLEEMLNDRPGTHPRMEVIKAGIPGYFPEAERILLDTYGRDYSPDIVLVGFTPNDVTDTHMGMDAVVVDESGFLKTREADELGQVGILLYRNSHVLRLLLGAYVRYRISQEYQPRLQDVYRHAGSHERDWQALEREYAKIAELAEELRAQVLIVHIPQKGPWRDIHYYPPRRLAEWASEKNQVHFVDALPALEQAVGGESLYYEKDGHCTPHGYGVIAREIYRYATESGLVP